MDPRVLRNVLVEPPTHAQVVVLVAMVSRAPVRARVSLEVPEMPAKHKIHVTTKVKLTAIIRIPKVVVGVLMTITMDCVAEVELVQAIHVLTNIFLLVIRSQIVTKAGMEIAASELPEYRRLTTTKSLGKRRIARLVSETELGEV